MGKTLDLYRDMPDLGKDLIKYMDDELQNLNNEKSSNSSSLFQSMKDYYHGIFCTVKLIMLVYFLHIQ